MKDYNIVGKSIHRLDGLEKVLGSAVYVNDIFFPGMLYVKAVRSPYSHAKILSINTRKAEKLEGVKSVITCKDLKGNLYGAGFWDQPVLAIDRVRYVGEPVAAIAAETLNIAEEAVKLVDVEYEILPAVYDVEEAFKESPDVIIHPQIGSYQHSPNMHPRLISERPNVYQSHIISSGNLEKGFKEADLVIENRYTTAMIHHVQMEPHCAIAKAEPNGTITIWASTGTITAIRSNLSKVLEIPTSKIKLIVPYVGGQFGGRQDIQCSAIATVLSQKTNHPVKYVFSREEMFHCATVRCPSVIYVKDGVKADGTLIARELKMLQNGGGYSDYGFLTVRNSLFVSTHAYNIPHFKATSYGVYTNLPKSGPYRGFSNEQVNWAIENQMDIIAQKLNIDAVELRMKNLMKENQISPAGEEVFSFGVKECLDKVVKAIDYNPDRLSWEEGEWVKGIGLAIGNKYSLAPTASCATVRACEDGSLDLFVGLEEVGQGSMTVLAQIAAEEMGLEVDDINIISGNTSYTPFDEGAISSRMTFNTGNAICLACRDLKSQMFKIASEKLGVCSEELELTNKMIYSVKNPLKKLHVRDLFTFNRLATGMFIPSGGELIGKATWYQTCTPEDKSGCGKRLNAFFIHGAQAIQVAVHKITKQVVIEKLVSAFDAGKAINPILCEGQIEGGAIMGIGSAVLEEIILDEKGNPLNTELSTYLIPTVLEVPTMDNFRTFIVEAPHREGPFGAKGLGEGTLIPTAPAVNQAIYNAIGYRSKSIPIKAEDIAENL